MVSMWKDGFLAMHAAVFRVKGSCCPPDNLKRSTHLSNPQMRRGLGKKIVIVVDIWEPFTFIIHFLNLKNFIINV